MFKFDYTVMLNDLLAELEKDIDNVVKNKYDLNVSENLIDIINVYAREDDKHANDNGID